MARKFSLVLAFCASFCFLYAHSLQCSTMSTAQMKCFQDAGIQVVSQESVEVYNIITSDVTSLCRNLSKYQDAAACAANVTLQCAPANYANYFTTLAATRNALAKICENIDVVKFNCLQSVYSKVKECAATKYSSYKQDGSQSDLMCFVYKVGTECANEVLPTCGCQTTKMYVETFKMLNPTGCNAIPVSTPVCRPGTDEFFNSGTSQRISLLTLIAFVFCGLYCKM